MHLPLQFVQTLIKCSFPQNVFCDLPKSTQKAVSVLLGRQVEEENHGGCLGEAAGLSMTAVSISPHTNCLPASKFSILGFLSLRPSQQHLERCVRITQGLVASKKAMTIFLQISISRRCSRS